MNIMFLTAIFNGVSLPLAAKVALLAIAFVGFVFCFSNLYFDRKVMEKRMEDMYYKISILNSENYKLKCANEGLWLKSYSKMPEVGKTVLIRWHRNDEPFAPYIYDTDICLQNKEGEKNWMKHKNVSSIDWSPIP